jgi:hypothetical protein
LPEPDFDDQAATVGLNREPDFDDQAATVGLNRGPVLATRMSTDSPVGCQKPRR